MPRFHALILRSVVLLVLLGACTPVLGWQDGQPEPPPDVDSDTVSASEQAVGVESQVDDGRIAERLAEVLRATERFASVDVEVREGVAFLRGSTEIEESRALAGDLARRTEGVVAVVNNITIEQGPIWTLEPAKEELIALWRQGVASVPLVGVGLVVLVLAFVAASLVRRVLDPLIGRWTDSALLEAVLRKVVYAVVLIIGIYIALRVSGMTRIALTVVSGTGIIGLILGFAFRDIAENFLASLLLSVQRPFRLGDVIEVDGKLGVVRKVTNRGTLLIDFDGNHIQISNATVYKSTIKNFSANPKQRLTFTVGIGYDDDVSHAQEVLWKMLDEHDAILDDPEPLVLVEELGASTVNLRAYYWIDGSKHSMLKVGSSAMRLAKVVLTREGISMPDESREVIFPQGVPVHMVEAEPQSTAEAPPPPPPAHDEGSETATEAEGGLAAEADDLEKQANESRDPEEGSNVIGESRREDR